MDGMVDKINLLEIGIYVFLFISTITLIMEMISGKKLYICIAISAFTASATALVLNGIETTNENMWIVPLLVFVDFLVIFLLWFAKLYKRNYSKANYRLNTDSAIGKKYTLLTAVEFNKPGTIKVNDVIWGVTTEFQGEILDAGSIVEVLGQRGNTYIVKKVKRV